MQQRKIVTHFFVPWTVHKDQVEDEISVRCEVTDFEIEDQRGVKGEIRLVMTLVQYPDRGENGTTVVHENWYTNNELVVVPDVKEGVQVINWNWDKWVRNVIVIDHDFVRNLWRSYVRARA